MNKINYIDLSINAHTYSFRLNTLYKKFVLNQIYLIDFDNKLRIWVVDNQYIKLRYFSISERNIHIYQ